MPAGGQIDYSSNKNSQSYDLGVIATYSCSLGYSLENGDEKRVCQLDSTGSSGVWSGTASECVGECIFVNMCLGLGKGSF